MRGRGPYHVEIDKQIKARLMHAKQLLADDGFKIFSVSKPMLRSAEDFIAVSSNRAKILTLLVRPTTDHRIEFRAFDDLVLFEGLKAYLKKNKRSYKSIQPIHFTRQLPLGDENIGWRQYIDPAQSHELELQFK